MGRCQERDKREQRCTVVGEHETITNSRGEPALAHETRFSLWSTPVKSKLEVPVTELVVVER